MHRLQERAGAGRKKPGRVMRKIFLLLLSLFISFLCFSQPLEPWEEDSAPFDKKEKFFWKKKKPIASEEELYQEALAYFYGKETWLAKKFPKQAEKYKNSRWLRPFYYRRSYQRSLELFEKLLYEYPLSKYLADADFFIAECHFKMEEYDVAIEAYKDFLVRHPRDPRAEQVYFNLALCHWNLRHKNSLRDQSETKKALEAFQQFIQLYPASSLRAQAEEYIKQAKNLLAEKEVKIADFYFKKKQYWQSALRYHYAWSNFPESSYSEYALFQEGISLYKMGKTQDAQIIFEELKTRFPKSQYLAKIPEKK